MTGGSEAAFDPTRRVDHESASSRTDAIHRLVERLAAASGFARAAVSRPRLEAFLSQRASALDLADATGAAQRALADPAEYARIEGHFSPPETWLFRYPESLGHVRAFAAARRGRPLRALVAGAGGWSEPCSIAAALLDGAGGGRVSVQAFDRNPEAFASGARFEDLALRGARPAFAARWFEPKGNALVASPELLACVRVEVARIGDVVRSRARESFDVVVCRNVAIYQSPEARDAAFRGLAALLAEDGMLLVGHAEVSAASQATGLVPFGDAGAFALARPRSNADDRPEVPSDTRSVAPAPANAGDRVSRVPEADASAAASRADPAADREPSADPIDHMMQAERLEREARHAEAFASIRRALYLDPKSERALLVAARLSETLGDAAAAARFRARALRIDLDRARDGGAP